MTIYIHIQLLTYTHVNTHFIDNIYVLDVDQAYGNPFPVVIVLHNRDKKKKKKKNVFPTPTPLNLINQSMFA